MVDQVTQSVKVLAVLGTRPEAIKLAPVIRALQERASDRTHDGPPNVTVKTCVTGQHRWMLDQVLGLFGIVPDFDLSVMRDNQSPTQVASAVLERLESVLLAEQPDWVLVQGDTTTVAAASLAAFYAGRKVAHIEAGLRTNDKWRPFPEEINRRVAGVISDLHFAPTETARNNLLREGVQEEKILVTGNPVIDALHWVASQPVPASSLQVGSLDLANVVQQSCRQRLILVTAHRRENFGQPLENICMALKDIAAMYGDRVLIVYPVHMNPNVDGPVRRMLDGVSNVLLTPPLGYLPLVHLMKASYLVLTDSGGVQEEAPGLGKPVMVLRDVTERPEAVDAGTVRLVGSTRERIVANVVRLLDDETTYRQMARATNPYGDGNASERIADALLGRKVRPWCGPTSEARHA